jgi:hypothetical protein
MQKPSFLVVVCLEKDLKIIAKTMAENGFKVWAGRQLGDVHVFNLTGSQYEINRVGCSLIGLEHSFPNVKMFLIDEKGVV